MLVVNSDYLLVVQATLLVDEDMSPLVNLIEDIKELLTASLGIYINMLNVLQTMWLSSVLILMLILSGSLILLKSL